MCGLPVSAYSIFKKDSDFIITGLFFYSPHFSFHLRKQSSRPLSTSDRAFVTEIYQVCAKYGKNFAQLVDLLVSLNRSVSLWVEYCQFRENEGFTYYYIDIVLLKAVASL